MTAAAPVRAVFFDIGNVLLRFSTRRVLAKMAFALKSNPIKLARYLWRSDMADAIERGALEGPALYELFRSELDYTGTFPQFRQLWCDHFTLDRGSHALLKSAVKRVPTYLLSNTNKLHFDYIRENYAFPGQVTGAILSHEVGLRKPEAAIYRKALALSKTTARETVFVDDLSPNVEAAAKLGFVAIQFRGAKDLRRRFAALGLVTS